MPHVVLTVFSALLGFSNCLDLVFKLEVSVWGPEQTNCLCFMFYILLLWCWCIGWIIWWNVKMVHVCPYTLLRMYRGKHVCIYIYIYKHFDRVVYLVQIQQSCVLVSFPSNDPTCSKLRVPMWCTLSVCILHENELFFSLLLHLHFFFFPFLFHV